MKKRLTILGRFVKNKPDVFNGQAIKTRIVYNELLKTNEYDVSIIDSFHWQRHPFRLLKELKKASNTEDHIMMMPSHKGFSVFIRLLPMLTKNKKCSISYLIIGGWLQETIAAHPAYVKYCNKFDAIFPETDFTVDGLSKLGVNNLYKIVNFKNLNIIEAPKDVTGDPKKFCIFSRIIKEKGIEDAVECIKRINSKANRTKAVLDIYGEIDNSYSEEFEKLKSNFPEYISYKGKIDFEKSVDTLKDYYALLFPTHYKTEGVPGTVIDAYASGIPVISYEWRSTDEIISRDVDGLVCEDNIDKLTELVEFAVNNEQKINSMRKNCIEKAKSFTPENNIPKLINVINKCIEEK